MSGPIVTGPDGRQRPGPGRGGPGTGSGDGTGAGAGQGGAASGTGSSGAVESSGAGSGAGPASSPAGREGRPGTWARRHLLPPRPVRAWQAYGPVRRRRILVTGAAVLLVLAGFGGWALYGSSWLRVEHVTVSGTRVLTPAEVRGASGVGLGGPLASVDTDAVAARLRHALPRIDSVDVVRSWPHGIRLEVTERTPVLMVEKGGKFEEVDAEGVRYATVTAPPKGVPMLELSPSADPGAAPSHRRFPAGRLVAAAVRVAADLPAAVRGEVRTVEVRSYDSISVELTRGRVIVWGSAELGAQKARTLSALMKAAPTARHFDVQVPTAPAVRAS